MDSKVSSDATPAVPDRAGRISSAAFLALTLGLPIALVLGNFALGAHVPITWAPEDDMALIDPVWRVAQGQHLGIDFHDPRGFGLFHLAALFWRLIGPRVETLRAAVDLFALLIVLCGALVAARKLRAAAGLAALFCVTVAFEASGPSIYGGGRDFGMALSYDRLLTAGLAVLFVECFAGECCMRRGRDHIGLLIAALLLNLLLLIKISGLVVGIAMVAGGTMARGRGSRGLADIALVLLFLALMTAIDFVVTGANFAAVVREYGLAARLRAANISSHDVLWFALRPKLLGSILLMGLYVALGPERNGVGPRARGLAVIVAYWACQMALDMTNGPTSPGVIYLAPAAIVVLATLIDGAAPRHFRARLWPGLRLGGWRGSSAAGLLPLLLLAIVCVPEMLGSLRALQLDRAIASGRSVPVVVTAHKGIAFEILRSDDFTLSFDRAVRAIEGLGVGREKIANLDFMDPFPALFLAPSPRIVPTYWDFNDDMPPGFRLDWREIVGDACIVMEPKHPLPPRERYAEPLADAMRPELGTRFALVYEDGAWRIWKRRADGSAPPACATPAAG